MAPAPPPKKTASGRLRQLALALVLMSSSRPPKPSRSHGSENDAATPSPEAGARKLLAKSIDPRDLDADAKRIVKRLQRNGHEAYFVGGCVRDLLIGREPKDFDVATSASPNAIRRLFRNGRIIGRRFRLVHIYYAGRICETATFRREPERSDEEDDEDLLIREDNEFGTAQEDAYRRDFTVNGLFLDPTNMMVLDYVDGLADLEDRLLRTIGDPFRRLAEDPVRIMRAVKFATRLDFEIEEETWDAICETAPDLARSAPARVFEEIVRLLRSGTSQGAFKMLWACGALPVLLPAHSEYLGRYRPRPRDTTRHAGDLFSMLEALDHRVGEGYQPSLALCLAALFYALVEDRMDRRDAPPQIIDPKVADVAEELLDSLLGRARVSRKEGTRARRILAMQPAFASRPTPLNEDSEHPSFSPLLFARTDGFREALDLFHLRVLARGKGRDIWEAWNSRYKRAKRATQEEIEAEHRRLRRGKRKRRRRSRRRKGGPGGDS